MGDAQRIRALLDDIRAGNPDAGDALFDLLYGELHGIADRLFRNQRQAHSLQPTILVHEAYARMMGEGKTAAYSDLTHFKAVAARAMRQVLLNHARDRNARKRGGGEERDRVSLSGLADEADRVLGVLQVHEALARLAELDERQARIAEYRLFAGLEHQEIADALGVSIRTVELDWKMAKLQLADWLELPV